MTFAMSAAALTVLSMLFGFVVHEALLKSDYMQVASLFRTEADHGKYFPYMILAHVFFGIGMTWVYRQGREAKAWLAQGVRFGLAMAVLTQIPMYLIYFAVQPMPGALVVKQIAFSSIGVIVMGVVAAWINQRDLRPAV